MAQTFKSLTKLASAFAVGIFPVLAEPAAAQTPDQLRRDFPALTSDKPDPSDIVRDSIFSLAGAIRADRLGHSAQTKKFLTMEVMNFQKKIIAYHKTDGHLPYLSPVPVDGKFGKATAEALLDFASRQEMEEVIINVPSLEDKDDINMRFLRNELEKLTPRNYIEAIRQYAQNTRENIAIQDYNTCLAGAPATSFTVDHLAKELKKLKDDHNYISDVVPEGCKSQLKELRIGSRFEEQAKQISKLGLTALKDSDVCTRREVNPSGITACLERKI